MNPSTPMRFPSVLAIMAMALMLGACAGQQADTPAVLATGPESSGQVAECTFRIVFASGSAELDSPATRALRDASWVIRRSGRAYVTPFGAAGESQALEDARAESVRQSLMRHGVNAASVNVSRLYDAGPAEIPYVHLTVCPLPLQIRRVVPDEPDRLIEYRFDQTTLRIPLRYLSYVDWNNVPLVPQRNFATLFQLRGASGSATAEDGISACRRNRGHQCAEDTEIRLRRRVPSAGFEVPPASLRRLTYFDFSRSRHGAGSVHVSFAIPDGSRLPPSGNCWRAGADLPEGPSAFTGSYAALCSVDGVPVTQTIIAYLAFRVRNLDEIPGVVESARGFVRQFSVPQDAAAGTGTSPP